MFHAFLCRHRQVDRFKVSCFSMSTGLALVYVDRFKVFALFDICAFPCLHVDRFIDDRPRIQNITVDGIFVTSWQPRQIASDSVYFDGMGGCNA